MTIETLILALSFIIILVGSELFTNGIEWAGEKLGIAEAAVGSLLAAVGTAMPETLIPAFALLGGGDNREAYHAVGVGAIIGAPLMLSTIALFVMGVASVAYRRRRNRIALRVVRRDARRDLAYFLPVLALLVLVGLGHPGSVLRHACAAALVMVYVAYSIVMLRLRRTTDSGVEHGLYLETILRGAPRKPRSWTTAVQVAVGLGAIIFGANEFVDEIVVFSHTYGLNPGVLSLILSPLATELPEKFNSVIWIRQRKDHLALGNITGAMVFQSCLPAALGLALTPWHLAPPDLLAALVALASASILFFNLRDSELGIPSLMVGGVAYSVFIIGLVFLGQI